MEIPINSIKPTIRVNFILDESGSMESQRDSAISGFNEYVQSHKSKTDANYLVSLIKFSDPDKITTVFAGKPVQQVRQLTREDYNPLGGTALYDAIARTVELTESLMRESVGTSNVLTFIFTDGDENASKVYDRYAYGDFNGTVRINKMITSKEDSGRWTFSFVGSSRDALKQAQSIGVKLGNTFSYNFNNVGSTIAAMSAATTTYATSMSQSLDNMGDGTVFTRSLFKDSGINSDADVTRIANSIKNVTTTTGSN